MPSKSPFDLGEYIAKVICFLLRGLAYFVAFRHRSKNWGWLVTTGLGFLLGLLFIWLAIGHPLSWSWPNQDPAKGSSLFLKASLALVTGFGVNIVFIRALGIIVAVAGQAPALRRIGLVEAIAPNHRYSKVVEKYRIAHEGSDKIKVICMAGRWVFRNKDTPLHRDLLEGKLTVILPKPIVTGDSFVARSKSAPEGQEADNSPESLVAATQETLNKLKQYQCGVFLHEQICIWRVVIFSNFCVVQSYIPNSGEKGHMGEPTLVFSNESEHSLYHTFSSMFSALEQVCEGG